MEERKEQTNIAGLTAEEAYLITKELAGRLVSAKCELERRKCFWEKENNRMWCKGSKGKDAFLDGMMRIQVERVRQIELALYTFGEKVMGFQQVIEQ